MFFQDSSRNDDIGINNTKCRDGKEDTFVMTGNDRRVLYSGEKYNKFGLNDCVILELIEDWFKYLEIGEDLLRIEILKKLRW